MTERTPYRSSGPLASLPTPPDELVYAPGDKPRRGDAIRRTAGIVWLGSMASAFAAAVFNRVALGGAMFAVVVGIAAWVWNRTRSSTPVVLRIEEGRLVSTGAEGEAFVGSIALAQIRNVRLETKTIEKLQTDRTIGAFVVSSSVRPAIEVSRIVIVPSKTWGAPFALSAEYEANFEAVEWLGKLRRFLRAYGWIPADERAHPLVEHPDEEG
jgi:hypothetical protein